MTVTTAARRLALVAVVAMLAALLPLSGALALGQPPPPDGPGGPPAEPDNTPEVVSLEAEDADDAVGRSTRISQFTFTSSTEALIGRDDDFADSLASGSLQGGGRPLLLTPSDALDQRVIDELNRLGVETVHIMGLEAAISEDVEGDIQDAGFETNRVGGATRIETAIEVAEIVNGDTAIVARAFADEEPTQAFADSLAAGGWAAEDQTPVLLTQTDVLTGNTRDHIEAAGYDTIYVVGGEAAVGEAVFTELEGLATTVERVSGNTRFETAVAVANQRGFQDSSEDRSTVITDGQGGDAWVDGFAIAAYSGLTPAPIVLSNSASDELPPPTADYLVDETDGGDADPAFQQDAGADFVLAQEPNPPDYVCTTNVVDCHPLVTSEVGAEGVTVPPRPGETNVTVGSNEVEQGGVLTFTIEGDFEEVAIRGCGYDGDPDTAGDQDHEVPGGVNEDGTFEVPITEEPGECTLIVIVDGEEFEFDITVTEPAGNQVVTTQPELVRAVIDRTVTTSQVTPTTPAGTYITYTFDETIAAANAADFFAYDASNNRYQGDQLSGFTSGSTTVTVIFTDTFLQGPANAAGLTLATVDDGAVTDFQGQTNPEGDARIGTPSSTTGGQAGFTSAPDLTTVSGFRQASTTTQTAVDFEFDENAFVIDPAGFSLITTGASGAVTEIPCLADSSTAAPSGGTVAGGSGTMRITVICDNPGGSTTTITQANIARGVVDDGTVSDAATLSATSSENPLQAADVSNGGNSTEPDLVSALFQPDAATGVDRVIYIFDQNVSTASAVPADFGIYVTDATGPAGGGATCCGEAFGTTIVQVTGDRIAVDFADGILRTATGAFVLDSAASANSQEDEVGVQNDFATSVVPGETAGPQLTSVVLREGTDATGASTGFEALYTFDEDVDVVDPLRFYLYRSNGTRLTATTCTNPTAEDTDNTVTCRFAGSLSETVASGVLGAVDFDAVREEASPAAAAGVRSNPEGSEVTTGGTGAPAN